MTVTKERNLKTNLSNQPALSAGELPLCVFGPGGVYRTAWPPGSTVFSGRRASRFGGAPGGKWPAPSASIGSGPRLWWSSLAQWFPDTCKERRLRSRLASLVARGVIRPVVMGLQGLNSFVEIYNVQVTNIPIFEWYKRRIFRVRPEK